jgi:hypothetical protein
MLRPKKFEIRQKKYQKFKTFKTAQKTKQSAIKLNQIRRMVELCLKEIILRFEMVTKSFFFLDNSIPI